METVKLNDTLSSFFSAYVRDFNYVLEDRIDLRKFTAAYYTNVYFESNPKQPISHTGRENILEYIKKNIESMTALKTKQLALAYTEFERIDDHHAYAKVTWTPVLVSGKELRTFSSTVRYLIWNIQNNPKILGMLTLDTEQFLSEK